VAKAEAWGEFATEFMVILDLSSLEVELSKHWLEPQGF
jgi:hypothetical protein